MCVFRKALRTLCECCSKETPPTFAADYSVRNAEVKMVKVEKYPDGTLTVNCDPSLSQELVQDGHKTACGPKSQDLKPVKVNFVPKDKVRTVSVTRLNKELTEDGKLITEKVTKETDDTHKIKFTEAKLEKIINNLAKRSRSDK